MKPGDKVKVYTEVLKDETLEGTAVLVHKGTVTADHLEYWGVEFVSGELVWRWINPKNIQL